MTTFLKISEGTELLNVDHISSFKIGHRQNAYETDGREHSIGFRVGDSVHTTTLISGLTDSEAVEVLGALGKAIAKATENGGIIDPQAIADLHVRATHPA